MMVGLAARYSSSSALLGLELMNEPTVRATEPCACLQLSVTRTWSGKSLGYCTNEMTATQD